MAKVFFSENGNSCSYVPHAQIPTGRGTFTRIKLWIIQMVSNCKPKDIKVPWRSICMFRKLFNPAISPKTIRHSHTTLHKANDYIQKIEREFHLVEEIQQTDFSTVMLMDASASNDPMKWQQKANITCYKCGQKSHYRKDFPNSAGKDPGLDQNMPVQPYSPPTTVTQTMTASYVVLTSSLVTIFRELAKAKQTNWPLKKNVHLTQPNQDVTFQIN